jgi:hypothetical protein
MGYNNGYRQNYGMNMNFQPQSYQNTLNGLDKYLNNFDNNNQMGQPQQIQQNTNMEFIKVANM